MPEIDEKYVADLLGMTTDELDAEIESFEDGTWDSSGFGEPQPGRALLFGEPAKPVTFKEAPSVIARMDARAAARGESRSEYLRSLVAADLAAAGA